MTNAVRGPNGLTPDSHRNGGTVRLNNYFIAGALASNIFRGDPVIPTATSKQINVATAGVRTIGVFKGVSYVDAGGNTQFRPYWGSGQTIQSNSLVLASVYDDPNTVFRVMVSGTAGLAAGDVGALADVTFATAGSTITGNSGVALDQTTLTTESGSGTTYRVEEVYNGSGAYQSGYGQYATALVRAAIHYLMGGTLTAG